MRILLNNALIEHESEYALLIYNKIVRDMMQPRDFRVEQVKFYVLNQNDKSLKFDNTIIVS